MKFKKVAAAVAVGGTLAVGSAFLPHDHSAEFGTNAVAIERDGTTKPVESSSGLSNALGAQPAAAYTNCSMGTHYHPKLFWTVRHKYDRWAGSGKNHVHYVKEHERGHVSAEGWFFIREYRQSCPYHSH